MSTTQSIIEHYYDIRDTLSSEDPPSDLSKAIEEVIFNLNEGTLRVAQKNELGWIVNQWVKKAVLLSFRLRENRVFDQGPMQYFDKVNLKYEKMHPEDWALAKVRVVPGVIAREGAFIAKNTVLMPSFVNIGAYIDEGTLVDTWATVGSCAQIGKNVHISGGAGIGGVLEPLQANPTIIEDNCFIGARSEIVEGVIVGKGSVISMGVFIGQSTKIYNRLTREISYGTIPEGSVVVSGNLPSKEGHYSLYCAVIVKQVDEQTRKKVSINDLLRDAESIVR